MPYAIYLNDDLVAYVDMNNNKTVIDRKRASLIESCLMAFGIAVNMGVDESISYPRKLDGFPVKVLNPDMDEGRIVKAIELCIGFNSGTRPTIEPIEGKLYEVMPTNIKQEGSDEEEIEFETA